jgi:hypothetical protein
MSTKYINKQSHASTLLLGWRLADDVVEFNSFASFGWIKKLYIDPQFHFTYYGFEWVKPLEIIPIYFYYSCCCCIICCARL